jgi:hypothetical protein
MGVGADGSQAQRERCAVEMLLESICLRISDCAYPFSAWGGIRFTCKDRI